MPQRPLNGQPAAAAMSQQRQAQSAQQHSTNLQTTSSSGAGDSVPVTTAAAAGQKRGNSELDSSSAADNKRQKTNPPFHLPVAQQGGTALGGTSPTNAAGAGTTPGTSGIVLLNSTGHSDARLVRLDINTISL